MNPMFPVLAASVTTFAATNLDDLFLLTVFFGRRVPARRIVVGQYLGFGAILLISVAAMWAAGFALAKAWLRLFGILPLVIGLIHLVRIHRSRASDEPQTRSSLSVASIAVITLANGADNIGVYVPFFLANRTHLLPVLTVYGLLVLAWFFVGKWLGNHPLVLKSLDRWGHWIMPFVLIALGL